MKSLVRGAYIVPPVLRQFAAALALLLCAGSAMAQTQVATRHNVAYGPMAGEQADLYLPSAPRGRRPAVVVIHGGGWVTGTRQFAGDFSTVLASMGVVVMNIDYRLADKADPSTRWPAQLLDAQLAVRFLRAHAAEYGIDSNHLGAVGDSAGAQLAVFLGTTPRTLPGDVARLYPRERPDVAAVVDQFGPMDLPSMGTYSAGAYEAMFGSPNPTQADLQSASPLPSITSQTAPTYIIHGRNDQVVPFTSSQRLVSALQANRVPVEFIPYSGDHGYQGIGNQEIVTLQLGAINWLVAQLRR